MPIKNYSTTPAQNNSAPPNGFPELMDPAGLNDGMRQVMADIKSWYDDPAWIQNTDTPVRTGDTTFTVTGDKTTTYVAGRRIRCTDSSTLYGVIASSSYSSPNTTVTVTLDSGVLSSSLSAVALNPWSAAGVFNAAAFGTAAFANTGTSGAALGFLNAANTWSGTQTIQKTSAVPLLPFSRLGASTNGDKLISITGTGLDSASNSTQYSELETSILSNTDGSESTLTRLWHLVAGVLVTVFQIRSGVMVGAVADQGAGTINVATNYFRNSVLLPVQKSYTSANQTITSAGLLTLPHSLASRPKIITAELYCNTTEGNWSVGDIVYISPISGDFDSTVSRGVAVYADTTNVYVRYGSDANVFSLLNKTTGAQFSATNTSWRLIINAFA